MIFHPLIELGLACQEVIVRIAFHEPEHGGECSRPFADGLAERPEPRKVQVGMPDSAHSERVVARGTLEFCAEGLPGKGGFLLGHCREGVPGLPEGVEDTLIAGGFLIELLHEFEKHTEVVIECFHLCVAHCDGGFLDSPIVLEDAEEIVVASISPQIHGLPACCRGKERKDAFTGFPQFKIIERRRGGQPLVGVPVTIHDEQLTAHIEQEYHILSLSFRRDGTPEVEPGAVEQTLPRDRPFAAGAPRLPSDAQKGRAPGSSTP